jgi:hypothetical protein
VRFRARAECRLRTRRAAAEENPVACFHVTYLTYQTHLTHLTYLTYPPYPDLLE